MIKTYAQMGPSEVLPYDQIPPLDVLGMLRVAWHGKWVIIATTMFAIICGGYYAFKMAQPQFAATATLQMDAQPAQLSDVSQHWPNPATDLASLNTEVKILTSDSILARVITQQDLISDPEFNRYLTPASPYTLNAFRGRLRQAITGANEGFPDQTAIAQKTLENLRGRLSANRPRDTYIFQITARSGDPFKAAAIANSAADAYLGAQIDAKDAAADAAITWLTQRVETLRAQLERQEIAVTDLIATVQIQQDTGLDTLSAAVLAIDEERARAATTLATFDETTNASVREVAEVAQLRAQIGEIDARRARLLGQLAAQSTGLVALQQMQREADATDVLYQSFLARLQETRVQRGLEYPDSRIVAPATAGQYVGPRKVLIVVVASAVGGLLGLMLVTIRHLTRKGVLHPQDLRQQTGRPVFAQMPDGLHSAKRLRRLLQNGGTQVLSPLLRKLKVGVMVAGNGHAPQVILLTATTTDEGHITLAMVMARALSTDAQKVLLIHADPENRTSAQCFPTLVNGADTAFDEVLGCDLLGIGSVDSVIDAEFADRLAALRKTYAHILILAPPVVAAAETLLLARYADAVIYAVRWAKTPVAAILHGLEMLEQATDAPIGLVLTKTRLRKMQRYAAISGSRIAALELA